MLVVVCWLVMSVWVLVWFSMNSICGGCVLLGMCVVIVLCVVC